MEFHESEAFREYINRLLELLRKALKNDKLGLNELQQFLDKKGVNLNLCFFTFFPPLPEDLDELEAELAHYLDSTPQEWSDSVGPLQGTEGSDLQFELNSSDLDFLRKNGIRF